MPAGPEEATQPTAPAAIPGVLSVGSTDLQDALAEYSRSGPWVDVAVPGQLWTTSMGGGYESFIGTSASSALVAGIAGHLRSTRPAAGQSDVVRALTAGVVAPGLPFARGRVDAAAALTALHADEDGVAAMPRGGTPLLGDWDGDGVDTPGVHFNGRFYLRNSPTAGPADVVLAYGRPSDTPVVGDWDGDGTDTIGVVRGNTFILRNVYRSGADDIVLAYGRDTDTPVVGDHDGNGTVTLGVVRADGTWILRNNYSSPYEDRRFRY